MWDILFREKSSVIKELIKGFYLQTLIGGKRLV